MLARRSPNHGSPSATARPLGGGKSLSRRSFLAGSAGGVGALASGVALGTPGCALEGLRGAGTGTFRIAHLTDIHVQPEGYAPEGMAAALRHVQGLAQPPELIINGGDCIRDSLSADAARTAAEWELWQQVLEAELDLPIAHCLGNHDIWGWALDDPTLEQDPRYGKAWAQSVLALASPYYAFDAGGWRFVVLDSMSRAPGLGYVAELYAEQWEWLKATLAAVPTEMPVCLVSHVPLFAACPFLDGPNEETGSWNVPGAWMHIDARRIKDLLRSYPNVRLCLSGHSHLQDRVEYLGVTYLCNGAVSGNWWQGAYQEFGPACALIDLAPDGSFAAQMMAL